MLLEVDRNLGDRVEVSHHEVEALLGIDPGVRLSARVAFMHVEQVVQRLAHECFLSRCECV